MGDPGTVFIIIYDLNTRLIIPTSFVFNNK